MYILWNILSTIALTGVEYARIEVGKKKGVKNLNHWISKILAVICGLVIFFLSQRFSMKWWQIILVTLVYAIGAAAIRLVFYDPVLNLIRGLKINAESSTTTSTGDQEEQKHGITFWQQRIIGLALAIPTIILLDLFNKIW